MTEQRDTVQGDAERQRCTTVQLNVRITKDLLDRVDCLVDDRKPTTLGRLTRTAMISDLIERGLADVTRSRKAAR